MRFFPNEDELGETRENDELENNSAPQSRQFQQSPGTSSTQCRNEFVAFPRSSTPFHSQDHRSPLPRPFCGQHPSTLIQPISGPMQSFPFQLSFLRNMEITLEGNNGPPRHLQ